jgi:hypothetical protein
MYACRRGLDVIDEYRSMLGSSELRAQTTAHGAELANLGQRHALRLGRPKLMLAWSERWRAVALAVPSVRPPADEELQAELVAIRNISARLSRGMDLGAQTGPLRQERQRLERVVRARAMRTLGAGRRDALHLGTRGFVVSALLDELGNDRLLELVDIDGRLYVLACGEGRVRLFTAGSTEQAAREVTFARFMLRRLAFGPAVPALADVHHRLSRMGETLEQVLLGETGNLGWEGDRRTPRQAHAVPWGCCRSYASRAVSCRYPRQSWLRARREAAGDGQECDRRLRWCWSEAQAWPHRAQKSRNWR